MVLKPFSSRKENLSSSRKERKIEGKQDKNKERKNIHQDLTRRHAVHAKKTSNVSHANGAG